MSFPQVIGQDKAKKFLKGVMSKDKIPHAYLFAGIPGIGKTTMARALAMALNCLDPKEGEACGNCSSCRQIQGGNSPDFVIIESSEDSQYIKIEQIRNELNRRLSFAPFGRFRVSVIYQAEKMTEEASNAFLKTLEEPPPMNILILNATNPLDLLPTIASRCQKVSFHPLSDEDITKWLNREKHVDTETASILAKISAGSLGRSLRMLESGFLDKRGDWLLEIAKISNLPEAEIIEFALKCSGEEKYPGMGVSEKGETRIFDMLSVWETWYRDLLLVCEGASPHLMMNTDFSHKLQKSAGNFKINRLIESLFVINSAKRDLKRKQNTKLVMEHMLLNLKRLIVCQT
jgi:DNA polymerase-3 subunit delta'